MAIHLRTVYGCFPAVMAELSNYESNCMYSLKSLKYLLLDLYRKKFASPLPEREKEFPPHPGLRPLSLVFISHPKISLFLGLLTVDISASHKGESFLPTPQTCNDSRIRA